MYNQLRFRSQSPNRSQCITYQVHEQDADEDLPDSWTSQELLLLEHLVIEGFGPAHRMSTVNIMSTRQQKELQGMGIDFKTSEIRKSTRCVGRSAKTSLAYSEAIRVWEIRDIEKLSMYCVRLHTRKIAGSLTQLQYPYITILSSYYKRFISYNSPKRLTAS